MSKVAIELASHQYDRKPEKVKVTPKKKAKKKATKKK